MNSTNLLPPRQFKSKRQLKIWEKQQKENAAKRLNKTLYTNQSPFRHAERIYKSRLLTEEQQNEIVDFDHHNHNSVQVNENLVKVQLKQDLKELSPLFGSLTDKKQLDAYVMKNVPGLIVIPNAFTPSAQRRLIKQCLSDYTKPPHTSNLNGHYHLPQDGIWPLYEREQRGELVRGDADYYVAIKPMTFESSTNLTDSPPSLEDVTNDNDDALSTVSSMYSAINPTKPAALLGPTALLKKQRWVTLGYQYHWGTKQYDLDHPVPIPDDIAEIMKAVVTATENIGYGDWKNQYKGCDFKPEAGIINFYQLQSTLMGHVDQSEINMEAPLISLSLGHSCIYLIGGNTRNVKPIPLRLHSGDMIVMTAIARRAYHGVPRILDGTLPNYLSPDGYYEDAPDWKLYGEYMTTTRINLNIRQVFPNNKEESANEQEKK
ncbi:MAG: hypothetical protein EXX96DRAFT_580753 [Benjaminiella poitrasii]|nr:MAG: hypothetical protein EXX96DRAFT_580753 [Benjaminiella poitrasii]